MIFIMNFNKYNYLKHRTVNTVQTRITVNQTSMMPLKPIVVSTADVRRPRSFWSKQDQHEIRISFSSFYEFVHLSTSCVHTRHGKTSTTHVIQSANVTQSGYSARKFLVQKWFDVALKDIIRIIVEPAVGEPCKTF